MTLSVDFVAWELNLGYKDAMRYVALRLIFALLLTGPVPTVHAHSSGSQPPPLSSSTPIVYGGLIPQEAYQFESRIVPRMKEFLQFWERRGIRAHRPLSRLRVFVQPSPWLSKSEALESLYGPMARQALEDLMGRIRSTHDKLRIEAELKAFSCDYPPLFHSTAPDRAEVERDYQRIMDPARPIPGFETDNGFYLQGASGCSVLLLGRSSDPGFRPHPFMSPEVVLHELSHGLIEGLVADHKVVPRAFQETVADLLAHSYLDDNCHGEQLNPTSGALTCRRDMNRGGAVLSEALWSGVPHTAGDSVRKLFWDAYLEAGQETFTRSFGRALVEVLKKRPLVLQRDLLMDPFHRLHQDLNSDFNLLSAFVSEFCMRIGTAGAESCTQRRDVLGTLDSTALARLLRNSPTRVGASGRTIRIGEDLYRVAFTSIHSPTSLRLIAREGDGALTGNYVCREKDLYAPEKLGFLKCFSSTSGPSVNWTSFGAIRVNPY